MKPRNALAVVALIAFSALLLPARPAYACSCAGALSDVEALEDSDAVFSGVVVEASRPETVRSSAEPVSVRFQVDLVAKGDVEAETTVLTAAMPVSCGFPFEERERYLVFAYHGRGVRRVADASAPLHTNVCTNTRPMSAGEETPFAASPVQAQESPVPAEPIDPVETEGEPRDLTPFAIGTGMLSLAVLAYLLLRARVP